jgi:hypothetical protein
MSCSSRSHAILAPRLQLIFHQFRHNFSGTRVAARLSTYLHWGDNEPAPVSKSMKGQMSGAEPKPASSPRRFPRYPIDIRVSLQVFRSGEVLSLWGRSNELGADGIGATLTRELEPGEVVSMEFTR